MKITMAKSTKAASITGLKLVMSELGALRNVREYGDGPIQFHKTDIDNYVEMTGLNHSLAAGENPTKILLSAIKRFIDKAATLKEGARNKPAVVRFLVEGTAYEISVGEEHVDVPKYGTIAVVGYYLSVARK